MPVYTPASQRSHSHSGGGGRRASGPRGPLHGLDRLARHLGKGIGARLHKEWVETTNEIIKGPNGWQKNLPFSLRLQAPNVPFTMTFKSQNQPMRETGQLFRLENYRVARGRWEVTWGIPSDIPMKGRSSSTKFRRLVDLAIYIHGGPRVGAPRPALRAVTPRMKRLFWMLWIATKRTKGGRLSSRASRRRMVEWIKSKGGRAAELLKAARGKEIRPWDKERFRQVPRPWFLRIFNATKANAHKLLCRNLSRVVTKVPGEITSRIGE